MEPAENYYALHKFVSQSSLKTFLKSPHDYHWQYVLGNNGWAGSPAATLGSLVHCLILEPQLVDQQYFIYDEDQRPEPDKTMASNLNKAWKAALERGAQETGVTVVSQDVYAKADAMLQKLCNFPLASNYFFPDGEATGELTVLTEQAIFWKNDCSDLALKSKLDRMVIDWQPGDKHGTCLVLDYKTTSAANTQEFGWSVKKYGYDIQAAFYEDAARSYLEVNYPGITFDIQVLFIPQRTTAPYPVLGVLELDQQTLQAARTKYERALQELEGCLHTGIWESSNGIETLYLSKPLEGIFLPDTELVL